jgi:hypothetical protein
MFRTANDFIALAEEDVAALADRAKYYRALAAVLRARVPLIKSAEARDELLGLAVTYEGLAAQVESSRAPETEPK